MIRWISFSIAALFLLLAPTLPAGPLVFSVPEGNLTALKTRLLDAQSERANATHLLVEGDFRVGPADELPAIGTDVALIGHHGPARFIGRDGGPATLLRVEGNGSLHLSNIGFEGFDLGVVGAGEGGLLVNRGFLQLSPVQFRDNTVQVDCGGGACTRYKPLVANLESGEFRALQVSIVNSGAVLADGSVSSSSGAVVKNLGAARLTNVQLYLTFQNFDPPFNNGGQMWLRNVSFGLEGGSGHLQHEFIASPGRLQVSNSIIAGFGPAWCEGVISAGYNLVDNPQCGISARADIVGKSAGLRWQPVDARWRGRQAQMLTHALVPIAASPAVDSANEDWCPDESLEDDRGIFPQDRALDGDGDGVAHCDRGAFEIAKNVLQLGGVNGLYINPDADGHYVHIADTKHNTLVLWTTFDPEGKQAWIFGIAEQAVAGRSLIADAYINRNGRVSLSGQFDPATSEHWGRIEVDMTSCNDGQFSFFSDVPGFPSGRFEITRLAHVKRLGCTDG